MFEQNIATRFQASTAWVAIVSMLLAMFLPLLVTQQSVSAAVMTERSLTMDSSVVALADQGYDVSFKVATSSSTAGMVVAFCTSPLVGTTCTAPAGLDTNEATITLADGGSTTPLTSLTVDAATAANVMVIGYTANTPTIGDIIAVDLGTGAATNGIDNPSGAAGAFYARFLTYDTVINAAAWVSGTPGTHIDDGGVALSTADQISIDARVQETLNFCVGTTVSADDCGTVSGTTIDMGVLTNGAISYAAVADITFKTQVTTNAQNGVTLTYIGDNLAVGGAVCTDANTDVAVNDITNDYCINRSDDGDTDGVIVAGSEQWGIEKESRWDALALPETTAAFDAENVGYDGDDVNSGEFSFTPNAATTMASSAGVVDSETIEWEVGATINLTTPSGLYETTLTFVATGIF